MRKDSDSGRIHAVLDGELEESALTVAERENLARYRSVLAPLEGRRVSAPEGLEEAIRTALRERKRISFGDWLKGLFPSGKQWLGPALAGAAAMLALMLVMRREEAPPVERRVAVYFQVHAPGAHRVELLGDFNNWTPGAIALDGPDASGHWTATVRLPEGRYEYLFLVDGDTWVTDPAAFIRRPDGFGRENAVIEVVEDRS